MNDISSIVRAVELRSYQEDAITALLGYWRAGGGNPLVEMATGTGKTLIIAELSRRLMASVPRRILVVTHVRELIEQDERAIRMVWPDAPLGIYCAGLNRREPDADVCLASIQSLHRNPEIVGQRNLVIVDEAHLVPRSGEGMYRRTLEALTGIYAPMRICGLTATPYRLDCGRLDEGKDRLFDRIVYSYDLAQAIDDGWLAPLVQHATRTAIDTSAVGRRGGEFVTAELENAAERVVSQAVDEVVRAGRQDGRSHWLVFCVGVPHALHVRDALRERGVNAETVTGETPARERDRIFESFRNGEIEALTGCNVFSVGFDAPLVDFVAVLRPTLSTGLFIQMIGRGTRLAVGKRDCLLMDFGGNVERHGPIDALNVHGHGREASGRSEAERPSSASKLCPKCNAGNTLNARACRECGHLSMTPHDAHAPGAPLFTRDMDWIRVDGYSLFRHLKEGSRPTLRVSYRCGSNGYSEWLPFEHNGRARYYAARGWKGLGGSDPVPMTVDEAMERQRELCAAVEITLRREGEFQKVVGRRVAPTVGIARGGS
jgi:DNA repair protein RadD